MENLGGTSAVDPIHDLANAADDKEVQGIICANLRYLRIDTSPELLGPRCNCPLHFINNVVEWKGFAENAIDPHGKEFFTQTGLTGFTSVDENRHIGLSQANWFNKIHSVAVP